jgi:hypothetical protein
MLRVEDDFCGNGEIAAVDRSMELQTHQGAR